MAVETAGKATPKVHQGTRLGTLHHPPSPALTAPALTQAQCQGQPGTASSFPELLLLRPFGSACPVPTVQRRSHCWGSSSVPGGSLERGQPNEHKSSLAQCVQGHRAGTDKPQRPSICRHPAGLRGVGPCQGAAPGTSIQ